MLEKIQKRVDQKLALQWQRVLCLHGLTRGHSNRIRNRITYVHFIS